MKEFLTKWLGRWIVDPETLHAYRMAIPSKLTFRSEREDGKIIIYITTINDQPLDKKTLLVTEADNEDQVVPMVNDLIMTYKDVPLELRPYFEKDLVLNGYASNQQVMVKA